MDPLLNRFVSPPPGPSSFPPPYDAKTYLPVKKAGLKGGLELPLHHSVHLVRSVQCDLQKGTSDSIWHSPSRAPGKKCAGMHLFIPVSAIEGLCCLAVRTRLKALILGSLQGLPFR